VTGVKTIQIHNVPDDLYQELRVRAAATGTSLSDYVLAELSRPVAKPAVAEVLRRAQGRSDGLTHEQAVDAIRGGRPA